MAEIKFNTLYDQMSGANQDFYDDTFTKYYNPDQAWTNQKNVLTMKTLPNQSTPDFNAMRTAYDQGAESKTLGNFNWGKLVGMGSADAAMPSDAERAAINNTGIMGPYNDLIQDPVRRENLMESRFNQNLARGVYDNPTEQIGPIMNFKDAPREFGEPRMNNPRVGPIDMWRNQGGDETTRRFPGILGMVQNMFQGDPAHSGNLKYAADEAGFGTGSQRDQFGMLVGQSFMNPDRTYDDRLAERKEELDRFFAAGKKNSTYKKQQQYINNLLQAKEQQKIAADAAAKTSATTIRPSHYGEQGGGGYRDAPIHSAAAAAAQGIDVGATGMMGPGGKHYMLGGRVGYNTGGRVGILSVF